MDFTFYFIVTYGFIDCANKFTEKTEYGFIIGDSIIDVIKKLNNYYGEDLVKITVEFVSDSGVIAIGNKEEAERFKKEIEKYNEI